jgi:hypothetical protein
VWRKVVEAKRLAQPRPAERSFVRPLRDLVPAQCLSAGTEEDGSARRIAPAVLGRVRVHVEQHVEDPRPELDASKAISLRRAARLAAISPAFATREHEEPPQVDIDVRPLDTERLADP